MMTNTSWMAAGLVVLMSGMLACQSPNLRLRETAEGFALRSAHYGFSLQKAGFRFALLDAQGDTVAPAHVRSGLFFGDGQARSTQLVEQGDSVLVFLVENEAGQTAKVRLDLRPHSLQFSVHPSDSSPQKIYLRTGGVAPAFGLGEQGGYPTFAQSPASNDLTGFAFDTVIARYGADHHYVGRLESNFVIFPRQGLAEVNIEPGPKVIRLTADENAQGSTCAPKLAAMHYFFGDPKQIYRDFLAVRNASGYRVDQPKYAFFGLGWESWGVGGYNTDRQLVQDNVQRFLAEGYPIRWVVIGSGFWPSKDSSLMATTSFGMWDEQKYPGHRAFLSSLHEQGLKVILGLRIYFIEDGPFTAEGLEKGYFIQQAGQPKLLPKVGFPKSPVYVLDGNNAAAVAWYLTLVQRWLDDGVDGFKEDIFGYAQHLIKGEDPCLAALPDDKLEAVNQALMDQGAYVMARNAYLGSAADIHRFEDFNVHHQQDRGPLSSLALAYSGFPYVYPDVVGGEPIYDLDQITPAFKRYLMRLSMFGAVHPAMAFGNGPWITGDTLVQRVMAKAGRLHGQLHPHLYHAAIKTYQTGFPYTLTPLPLAFPQDSSVYQLADTLRRSYQWLIGESLMATPLYGNDYATAQSRDVYLPAGTWVDLESGDRFEGGQTLPGYALPLDKAPLLVGGNGLFLWQESPAAPVVLRAFAMTPRGETLPFYLPDDGRCTVRREALDWDPDHLQVLNQAGQQVPFQWEEPRQALRFPVQAGEQYVIRAQ
jgi:hypothetical protein